MCFLNSLPVDFSWARVLQVSLSNRFRDLTMPPGTIQFLMRKQDSSFNQNPFISLCYIPFGGEKASQLFTRAHLSVEVGCC